MELFFSPLACSMAARITLYEIGVDARFVPVEPRTKALPDGTDYRAVHPLGLVPALRTDDGALLTENASILQHLADRHPEAHLAPRDPAGRSRLHEWLSFVGTELHKTVLNPLLDRDAPDAVRAYALSKSEARLSFLAAHLERRVFLLDAFSVADAYASTVLGWAPATPIDLAKWPSLTAYLARVRARPAVQRALGEEMALYRTSQR
ncbi:glutathione S-transferase N-terminal domain-containing protein [Sandaracinus amylolyticus]|uniref:Glutathione S-transferase n=1 Tax=Sandaracinus amylolyticus TaxID=927083 RepID=A0A0F6W8S3_9BACT|nr:glutathione S-transferase N-terminal domain-containing protein [Sandaracinus amylolyticus]AKF10375.1 Glutathione S-transferase [Sandaracinus amylolyticus]